MGGDLSDVSVSICCVQNAAPIRAQESPVPMEFPGVAKQMRRLSDPCGAPGRQGVLSAADWDMGSGEADLSYEARAEVRKAERARNDSPGKSRSK